MSNTASVDFIKSLIKSHGKKFTFAQPIIAMEVKDELQIVSGPENIEEAKPGDYLVLSGDELSVSPPEEFSVNFKPWRKARAIKKNKPAKSM
jgi:acetamidase/formamidase